MRLPEPYDFDVSTERFRAFVPDVVNLWHEGRLHRVVGGREVRIEAAPGGVLVEPLDGAFEAEVRMLLACSPVVGCGWSRTCGCGRVCPSSSSAFIRWSSRAGCTS